MAGLEDYPNMQAALQGPVVDTLRAYWEFLAKPHAQTGNYIRGLYGAESIEYPYANDALAISLRNVVDYAAAVEYGHEAFHLPSRIKNWTHFVKKGPHAGMGYIIVPLRHLTPGQGGGARAAHAMPANVYQAAKQLNPYATRQPPYRLTGNPNLAGKRAYFFVEGLRKDKPWHSAPIHEGMIRNVQENKNSKSSVFTTFRILGQWSTHWNIPAQPGEFFTRRVAQAKSKDVATIISAAAKQDMVALVAVSMSAAGFEVRI